MLPDEEESCRPHFVFASTDLCALVALLLSSSDNALNGTASKEEWVNHFQLAGNFRQPLASVIFVQVLILYPSYFYIMNMMLKDLGQLPKQLRNLSLDKTHCVCVLQLWTSASNDYGRDSL